MKEWNKFWFWSLDRAEQKRIVLSDARFETPWVREITRIAIDNVPGKPREAELRSILDEDIL